MVNTPSQHHAMLHAILSELYADRLYPSTSVLKNRLTHWNDERPDRPVEAALRSAQPPFLKELIDAAWLAQAQFNMFTQDGGAVIGITLAEEPAGFEGWVEPSDVTDPYSDEFWKSFETFVTGLHSAGCYSFTGGRYGTASELRRMQLPFLEGRRLGELCHIVHLAIQRHLFAYDGSMIIPGAMHDACRSAEENRPMLKKRSCRRASVNGEGAEGDFLTQQEVDCSDKAFVQTEEELCNIIVELLKEDHEGEGLNLSKLKRLIMKRWNLLLSETIFGCTKLLELVHQTALKEVCVLRSAGNMHTLHLRNAVAAQSYPCHHHGNAVVHDSASPAVVASGLSPHTCIPPPPGSGFSSHGSASGLTRRQFLREQGRVSIASTRKGGCSSAPTSSPTRTCSTAAHWLNNATHNDSKLARIPNTFSDHDGVVSSEVRGVDCGLPGPGASQKSVHDVAKLVAAMQQAQFQDRNVSRELAGSQFPTLLGSARHFAAEQKSSGAASGGAPGHFNFDAPRRAASGLGPTVLGPAAIVDAACAAGPSRGLPPGIAPPPGLEDVVPCKMACLPSGPAFGPQQASLRDSLRSRGTDALGAMGQGGRSGPATKKLPSLWETRAAKASMVDSAPSTRCSSLDDNDHPSVATDGPVSAAAARYTPSYEPLPNHIAWIL